MVGRNPMKDWRAAVRTWEKRDPVPVARSHTATHPAPYSHPVAAHQAAGSGGLPDKRWFGD